MIQENVKKHLKHPNENDDPRTVRKAKLMELYKEAAIQKKFEVKREDFDNDLILSKLKKYLQ